MRHLETGYEQDAEIDETERTMNKIPMIQL